MEKEKKKGLYFKCGCFLQKVSIETLSRKIFSSRKKKKKKKKKSIFKQLQYQFLVDKI